MIRLTALLLVVCMTACKESKKETEPVSPGLQEKIIGRWTDGTTENATFDILQDSIHYIDMMNHHKYELTDGDSIKIQYPYYTYLGKVGFVGDTLVITDGNGTSRYWKFK